MKRRTLWCLQDITCNATMSRRDRALETSPAIYCEDNSLNTHRRHSGKCKNSNQRSSEGATPVFMWEEWHQVARYEYYHKNSWITTGRLLWLTRTETWGKFSNSQKTFVLETLHSKTHKSACFHLFPQFSGLLEIYSECVHLDVGDL